MQRWAAGRAAWMAALAVVVGCGDRGEVPPAEVQAVAPAPGGVGVALSAPHAVPWNTEARIRARVTNATAAALEGAILELFLPAGLEVAGDTAGVPPGTERITTAEGTRLRFPLGELAPGASREVLQRVRTPPAPTQPTGATPVFPLRAAVSAAAGTPLGPPALDTLRVLPGSAVVAGGCGSADEVTATRYGIGPVRLGARAEAVRTLCPEARDTSWQLAGTRERGAVVRLRDRPVLVALQGDTVSSVIVTTPGVRTGAGVGVGSTVAELRGTYGRMCVEVGDEVAIVWFPAQPGIRFAVDAPGEGESEDSFPFPPDEAAVTSLRVRAGEDECPRAGREDAIR